MHPLEKLCNKKHVEVDFIAIAKRTDKSSWDKGAKHYHAIITYQGRELRTEYSIGSAVKAPVREDLIASLLNDATFGRESFEEFCDSCGYDTDSRKAYATWEACKATVDKVEHLFGNDLALFEEAAQDY